jgi:hypothetical protein
MLYWECHQGNGMGAVMNWRTLDGRTALEQPYPWLLIQREIGRAVSEAIQAQQRKPRGD